MPRGEIRIEVVEPGEAVRIPFGRKPTLADVERARQRVAEVEEKYRLLDSPEARAAVQRARSELEEIQRLYDAELRRIKAVKEAKARERASKQAEARKRAEEARMGLRAAAEEMEVVARVYWQALGEWARAAVQGVEVLERLGDRLLDAKAKLVHLAYQAQEIRTGGRVAEASEVLREILRVAREKSCAQEVEPVPEDLRVRLLWAIRELASVGRREEVGPVSDLPAGGPSLAKEREIAAEFNRERERRLRAWSGSRRWAKETRQ